jgi:hypothetical protein
MFEEEMNSLLRSIKERQPSKKRTNPFGRSISKFFFIKDIFFKKDASPQKNLEDLSMLIIKNNLPIQFVENMWLKHLIFHLCPKLNFLSKRQFSQDILP